VVSQWDAVQLRLLREAVQRAGPIRCPACGGAVARSPVAAPPGVSYVRRRVLLVCSGCHRSGAVDLPHGAP
jgi:hypothetical protein